MNPTLSLFPSSDSLGYPESRNMLMLRTSTDGSIAATADFFSADELRL
jgi:hypothetical protein